MVLSASLGKGGTERVFSLLLERFNREVFAPELALFDHPIAYPIPDDVPVHVLSERPMAASRIVVPVPPELATRFADDCAWIGDAAARLAELVQERQPDVIVVSPAWASIMALVASVRFPESTRLINIVGGMTSYWLSENHHKDLFAYLISELFNRSDRVVAVSQGVGEDMRTQFGLDPALLSVIHTPANIASIETMSEEPLDDPAFSDGVPVVLAVGRLERVKGAEYLLRAIAKVAETTPVRCVLVGDGRQKGYLVALAKHLGISDRVFFAGSQANPFTFMRRATLLALSSLSEGMPNVLLEAMACGCPVVATDIEGGVTREVLEDGACGLIVPRADADALAEAISALLGDAELRSRLSREGKRRARDFDLPRIVTEFEDLIVATAAEPAASRPPEPQRVRVLLQTTAMTAGGSQRFLSFLLDHLDRSRFEIVVSKTARTDADIPVPSDVAEYLLTDEPRITPPVAIELSPGARRKLQGESAWAQTLVDQIAHLVDRVEPDVVICAPEWIYAPVLAASSRFPSQTALIGRFGAAASKAFPDDDSNPVFRSMALNGLNRAGQIVSVSPAIAQDLAENFGVDPERISLIHNIVDSAKIEAAAAESVEPGLFDDDTPTALFVGRLERVKGLDHLLEAVAQMSATTPIRCVIVGDGSQREPLAATAERLGIAEHVHFVGAQRNPFRFMSRATMFVLPSLSEGMPNVLLEAMACGCPVIATDIAGGVTRQLLEDGACGLIVPIADSAAIAAAIARLLEDPDLSRRLAQEGLRRATDFSLPDILAEYERLITGAVERARLEPPREVRTRREGAAADSAPVHGPAQWQPRAGDTGARPASHLVKALASRASHSRPATALRVLRSQGLGALWRRVEHQVRISLPRLNSLANAASLRRMRARAAAAVRNPGRIQLIVLVPTMDDEYMGAATPGLLRCFDRDSYDVRLVRVLDAPDDTSIPADVAEFRVEPLFGSSAVVVEGLSEEVASRHRRELRWMDAKARGLGALATELGADVILAQGFYACVFAGLARPYLPPTTAVVAGIHSYPRDFIGAWDRAELHGPLVHAALAAADRVVAPVEAIAQDWIGDLAVCPDRVAVVPDPIDVLRDEPSEPRRECAPSRTDESLPTFVCRIGSDSPRAQARVLEAVAAVGKQQHIRCLIAHEGAVSPVNLAAGESGAWRVEFLDGPERIRECLAGAVACIDCGGETGARLPIAVAEAVAAGCPVIAMGASGATCRFVEEGGGVVVAATDAEGLAEAMLQILWDEEFSARAAHQATERLEALSPSATVPQLLAVVAAAVDSKAPSPTRQG